MVGVARRYRMRALPPKPERFERLVTFLARPRAHWAVIAGVLVLLATCLPTRMVFDDFVLAVKARADGAIDGLPSDPYWLFTFTTGDAERNQELMDEGVLLPWWSDPLHLNSFFRPLTSLTHLIDFSLWPQSAPLMHLHSMLWYALVLCVLVHVYRAIEPEAAQLAGLAFLLFAWDDAHGATVGWISNRNALVAVALALPALYTHHRRASGSRVAGWIGPPCFALGLAAGEAAIAVAGYLLAYALCLDSRPWMRRALSLAPYVALLLAHRGIYRMFGLGSFGSSSYHDPASEPFEFLITLGYNLPVLLSAQLLLPLADYAFWGKPELRGPLWLLSALGLAALAPLFVHHFRRDARARFWGVGMVLSAVPISASLPGERLLLVVGIGAAPLLARLLLPLADAAYRRAAGLKLHLLNVLAAIHVVASPIVLPLRAFALEPVASAIDRLDRGIPSTLDVRDKIVVIVNAPYTVMASYLQVARATRGKERPAQLIMLASSSSELTVTRAGSKRLRVELSEGFLNRLEETQYRADKLAGTDEVALRGIDITVQSRTGDGRPKVVEYTFASPLESRRYLLRAYRDGHLVPWSPPATGASERFPRQEFFDLVVKELRRW